MLRPQRADIPNSQQSESNYADVLDSARSSRSNAAQDSGKSKSQAEEQNEDMEFEPEQKHEHEAEEESAVQDVLLLS